MSHFIYRDLLYTVMATEQVNKGMVCKDKKYWHCEIVDGKCIHKNCDQKVKTITDMSDAELEKKWDADAQAVADKPIAAYIAQILASEAGIQHIKKVKSMLAYREITKQICIEHDPNMHDAQIGQIDNQAKGVGLKK